MQAPTWTSPEVEIQACGPFPGGDSGLLDHELVLIYPGVSRREVESVERGRVELALVVEPPLIVLCFRFGDAIPWSIAAYHWRPSTRPGACDLGVGTSLKVCLIDASDGEARARRRVPLSRGLALAWRAAIRLQGIRDCSPARHAAALAQFARKYSHPEQLLAQAVITSVDGR